MEELMRICGPITRHTAVVVLVFVISNVIIAESKWVEFVNCSALSTHSSTQTKLSSLSDCQTSCTPKEEVQQSCSFGLDWNPTTSPGSQCTIPTKWLPTFYGNSPGAAHYEWVVSNIKDGCDTIVLNECLKLFKPSTNIHTNPTSPDDMAGLLRQRCSNLDIVMQCVNSSGCNRSNVNSYSGLINFFYLDAFQFGCSHMEDFVKFEYCFILGSLTSGSNTGCSSTFSNIANFNFQSMPEGGSVCGVWNKAFDCFLSIPERCGSVDFISNFTQIYLGGSYVREIFKCSIDTIGASQTVRTAFCDPLLLNQCIQSLQNRLNNNTDASQPSICSILVDLGWLSYTGCTVNDLRQFKEMASWYALLSACTNRGNSISYTSTFRMKDKVFIPDYQNLLSDASKELATAICKSYYDVTRNISNGYLENCTLVNFTAGSVIATTKLDARSDNTTLADDFLDQLKAAVVADFNSSSGMFNTNLNSTIDDLQIISNLAEQPPSNVPVGPSSDNPNGGSPNVNPGGSSSNGGPGRHMPRSIGAFGGVVGSVVCAALVTVVAAIM